MDGFILVLPQQNLGAYGDAGMMVCQDDALAERLKRLRLHGGAKQYFHDEVEHQQPARHAAGRGPPRQAPFSRGLERGASPERRAIRGGVGGDGASAIDPESTLGA